jgi:hypothetical protein
MNKDFLDQIPADEQPVASTINSFLEDLQPSQAFQWDLENQLMDKAIARPAQGWFSKIILPIGWAIAAIVGVFLLNEAIRSLVPQTSPAAGLTPTHEISFADNVRSGNSCMGPLAVGHGFVVFLLDPEKAVFAVVDVGNTMVESRTFNWSADGERLAIVGNSLGSGNVYLTNPHGTPPQPILPNGELGYLMDLGWSRDGKQFITWSTQNNRVLYLLNADGTEIVEKRLGNAQILGTPQFWPDGSSVVFYGADTNSVGLFEMTLADSQVRLINPMVEHAGSFAFSPDGSQLAYMEYDRDLGEARLVLEELTSHEIAYLGSLSIPKGFGSSVPETANLSWSPDGKSLVFDFGRSPTYRAVYLAKIDGTEFFKVADSAYAPAISDDGKCIAYISNYEIFLVDMTSVSANPATAVSMALADLPSGRGMINFKQDKLQWRPGTTP